jgi:hypothetical protein
MHLDAEIQFISEMHLEAMIKRVLRFTWRPRSCHSEMHLEVVIEQLWRCTWRLGSSEVGDALGGHYRSRLEEYLQVVDVEAVVWVGGATAAVGLFIS